MIALRTRRHVALLLSLAATLAGCSAALHRGTPAPPGIVVEVRNHSLFEINVYALRPAGGSRMRLGTVSAFSSSRLSVSRDVRQVERTIILLVHAIGSDRSWTSQPVDVPEGVAACLDVYADPAGELDHSTLTTVGMVTDAAGIPQPNALSCR